MNHILRISFVVTILVFITSCKTTRTLNEGTVSNITDSKLRNSILENQLDFKKLYSKKLNISFNDGKTKKSFKGSYVIQKDSAIIVSIMAVMGIEVVRAQFLPNSIIILDKHNKKVFHTEYDFFANKYNLDINFDILQSILANMAFTYPPSDEPISDVLKRYKHGIRNNQYTFGVIKERRFNRLVKRQNSDLLIHDMLILPELYRISNHFIKDFSSNRTTEITYSEFTKFNNLVFPKLINVDVIDGINHFKLSLTTNNLEVNDGGSLHFKIPSSYEVTNM
ncbi:DUF4292 domain-containing protein [Saccharicrinis aurantiacus]|uniref:DUF4292 domain-containing protein n=1 Tax=Saccharicrinis aurantiacus TaxID=1849719 RepID=UPI00094F760B|nr:DUF4292 domain-containing protein [Saccharicrinis aurantiacus]